MAVPNERSAVNPLVKTEERGETHELKALETCGPTETTGAKTTCFELGGRGVLSALWSYGADARVPRKVEENLKRTCSPPLGGVGVKLLYWRNCLLSVACVTVAVKLVLGVHELLESKKNYLDLLGSIPGAGPEYGEPFANAMFSGDVAVFAAAVVGFVALVACTMASLKGRYVSSKRLLRLSFIITNAAPFVMLLVVPFRDTFDWSSAQQDMCSQGARSLLTSIVTFGVEDLYTNTLKVEKDLGLGDPLFYSAVETLTSSGVAAGTPLEFCAAYASNWVEELSAEHMQVACPPATCADRGLCKDGGSLPGWAGTRVQNACQGLGQANAQQCKGLCSNTDQAFELFMMSESTLLSLEGFSTALEYSEYIVGIALAMYAGKTLVPLSLGIVSGLGAASIQLKLFLPTSKLIAHVVVGSILIVLPLLLALLAMVFQSVGDSLLLPSLLALVAGHLSLTFRSGMLFNDPPQLLRKGVAYRIKGKIVMWAFGGIMFVWWALDKAPNLADHVDLSKLVTPVSVIYMVVSLLSDLVLTQAFSADCILALLLDTYGDESAHHHDDHPGLTELIHAAALFSKHAVRPVAKASC
ncbi:hypothetical protein HOP50_14g73070 [Chloropicon primus]|uniref:Uncharacterized protein n=1 Tax=Chloropicon primus TaxID=1764295 RepID=A0A5B8MZ20_9CHLO|nr:hypothetical protein A3770_14p72880 [Chloropicon primus]UPR03976.1 hypothetical protein HOP50_14g73070 [Chloropicon primus]|eukprot:QDZ24770.1 hypothetical protein A3770_14p72880 [Chloropicon primus]